MLAGIITLLICQLAGELLARLLNLPIPGPVLGLVILLTILLIRGEVPAGIRTVAETLLRYLALLFVPAGVGLMVYGDLIRADWQIMAIVLVVSTALTMLATALTFRYLLRRAQRNDD
ncbi:murein hydrolase regulator LrgA [Alkalilimnicola ehrlichii]|uniref:Murein hydrolase regulator LrgA n=1 Tax=Alkalilimnicola ehrlichii TaxID=351052 RepID=A0A3E0X3H0_9GAMM|nr:CidA/LrgA family protein [Alkalilimnicola ehrlichii]RFA31465.1 murein hydrolase regulator LrgA [Alkalilimnicola ehrlichii]RFA39264.1 murein hydrolase regulator LrgA [Alkalilimnicola ehrlichii]